MQARDDSVSSFRNQVVRPNNWTGQDFEASPALDFSSGLDADVKQNGSNVRQSQSQLLSLACALFLGTRIIVMDDDHPPGCEYPELENKIQ